MKKPLSRLLLPRAVAIFWLLLLGLSPPLAADPDGSATAVRRVGLSGAWSFKITTLGGELALLDGGGTRLMFLGRRLLVGAGGYRSHEGPEADGKALGCMYGGLWTEYDLQPDAPVHLSFGGLIAMGGAGYEESGSGSFVSSGALMLDPEIHPQVNLTEIMRLSLGAGYRCLVLFDDLAGMDKRDFNGPAAIVQLRFLAF